VSQGKGIDLDAATASGLMECAELYHAEHIELPLKLGSMAELSHSHRFAEIERLPRVNGQHFNRDVVTLWVEGREMISGETRWLPFECVRANYTVPPPPGSGFFDCSSNGLGSGNSLNEAIHHGICEIVERDATALWNRMPAARRRHSGVDLDSAPDGQCRDVLKKLACADFDVAAWEITSDVGVPAFFSLIADGRDRSGHCGIGAAAHPVAEIALLKALIEAAQVRTTYVSGARDDLAIEEYGETYRENRRRHADRLLAERSATKQVACIGQTQPQGVAQSVPWLIERLRSVGVTELITVDLTKEDIGLPVVRVVIPGLEGPDDHDGYVPGARARLMSGAER